jgi:hypothetical protein
MRSGPARTLRSPLSSTSRSAATPAPRYAGSSSPAACRWSGGRLHSAARAWADNVTQPRIAAVSVSSSGRVRVIDGDARPPVLVEAGQEGAGMKATALDQRGLRSASSSPTVIVTDSSSMLTTFRPTSGVTPSPSSARAARADRRGGNAGRTRSAISTSRIRAARVSMVRKSRRSVSCAISAICPASSTPVGPPPTTTNVSHAARRSGSRRPRPPRTLSRSGDGPRGRSRAT